jgi:cytochrome P450
MLITSDANIMRQVDVARPTWVLPPNQADAFAAFSQGLVGVDGPVWVRHRQVAQRAFRPDNLKVALSASDAVSIAWLRGATPGSSGEVVLTDLDAAFRGVMLGIMGRAMLSKPMGMQAGTGIDGISDAATLLDAVEAVFKGIQRRSNFPKPLWRLTISEASRHEFVAATQEIHSFVSAIVSERITQRASRSSHTAGSAGGDELAPRAAATEAPTIGVPDMLDCLLDAAEQQQQHTDVGFGDRKASEATATKAASGNAPLTQEEVRSIIADAILGALDTSSHTLAWLTFVLGLDGAGRLHPAHTRVASHLLGIDAGAPWYDAEWLRQPVPTLAESFAAHPSAVSVPGRIWAALKAEATAVVGASPASPLLWEHLDRLPYTEGCIKETLRLFHVLPCTGRVNVADALVTAADGRQFKLPKGSMVVSLHMAMHTDAALYPRPFDFLPERWLAGAPDDIAPRPCPGSTASTFHAFGGGPKACIGRRFAMVQMKAVLVRMAQRCRGVRPQNGMRAPDMTFALTSRSATPLEAHLLF